MCADSCRHGRWLLTLALMAWAASAVAGEGDDSDLSDEFALLEEEEIVHTAAKHKQRVGFSPSAVIVITRKDIEESGAVSLPDLLRRYPAVDVYEFDPLYPAIEIRGSYRVLMLIDGREINLELFVAPFFGLLAIGLHEIERIEIVLGPNSALYGANAVSAVINVVTRKVQPGFHVDAGVLAGQHGTTTVQGMVEGGRGDLSFRGTAGLEQAASWMNRSRMAKDMVRADGTVLWNIGDAELTFNGGFVNAAGRIFAMIGYLETESMLLAHARARLKWRDLKAGVFWNRQDGILEAELELVHPDLGLELGEIPPVYFVGDTVHADAQYDLEPFTDNLLILGADYRVTRYHSEQFVTPTSIEHRVGAYLHDEHRFLDELVLTVGVRFDWNSKTDFAVSPRGALVYSPAEDHYLRLSAGMAFRKPSVMETSANFRVDASPAFPELRELFEEQGISNPDLDNERLTTVEVGYRGSFADRAVRLSADLYAGFNRDIIGFATDVRFDQTPLGPRIDVGRSQVGYETVGEDSDSFGLHLTLEGDPLDQISLFLRADYRYIRWVQTGERSDRYPDLLVAVGATYRLPWGLTGQLAYIYIGSRRSDIRNPYSILGEPLDIHLPARSSVHATLQYGLDLGRFKLDLGLSLFNAFGAHQREEFGLITRTGTNYGGERIGPRAMLTARIRY